MTFILSVISAFVDGYNNENILSAFKTGFLTDDADAVSLLERYFYKWPYAARDFARPFTKNPSGFITERMTDEDRAADGKKLEKLNEIRSLFAEAVSVFAAAGKKNTVENYAKALYGVMTFVKMPEKIEKTADIYRNFDEHTLYAEQLRVYDLIIKMLDETVLVSGDREITAEEFRSVFLSAAENTDIAILPTSLDRVVAGTVAMLPFMSQKAVFILGCSDRVFPREVEGDALFSESELELLSEKDIELGKTLDEKVNYEKFLFSLAVSAASEKCFVSYSVKGLGTDAPSEYVRRIESIFPDLKEKMPPAISGCPGAEDRIVNDKTAFAFYSKTSSKAVASYLSGTSFAPFLEKKEDKKENISPENSERLFGKNIYLSPSNTDTYAQCPYSFFMGYGLKIKEDKRAEISVQELGNIIHKGLEKLLAEAMENPSDIHSIVSDFEKRELDFLFDGGEVSDSFKVHLHNVMKKLERLISRLVEEKKRSSFEIYACEKRVGRKEDDIPAIVLPLSSGSVSMGGIADRIDVFHGEKGDYFRVLDYKTGEKKYDEKDIKRGVGMQMLMYLCALVESEEKALPAGVSYVRSNPKPVAVSRSAPDAVKQSEVKKNNENKLGITSDEKEVLAALDSNNAHAAKPELYGTEAVTGEYFNYVFGLVKETLSSFGERIRSGDISKASPEDNKDGKACRYCGYKKFCNKAKGEDFNA